MAASNKQGKMQGFINYRMRATMNDGRQLVGQMLAFDKHMNLVLVDCEEYRKVKRKTKAGAPGATAPQQVVETEERRSLGLAIVRGAHVVSCSVDGPPPSDPAARMGTSAATPTAAAVQTPGISRPAGRGAGAGLQGPMGGQGTFPGFPGAPPMGRGFPPPGFGQGPPPGFAAPPPGFQPPPGRGGFGGR
ncbi:Small nuclear ribonucleoprotein-associated protein B [Recurvomyces mirabilis]|uniref:Sm protein B n=1 Tax=Recurvomyces mirabilis TaxID=574656 RepID=A0AAE0WID0_9PEZI|nr:Small nuclear ribonucleoprotein-associated protein B [Recurvomyces mirabilis]KAK5149794.1 Small nuclear ribonucleoprotein-associated protein B [Recurvomyces mirabilis]